MSSPRGCLCFCELQVSNCSAGCQLSVGSIGLGCDHQDLHTYRVITITSSRNPAATTTATKVVAENKKILDAGVQACKQCNFGKFSLVPIAVRWKSQLRPPQQSLIRLLHAQRMKALSICAVIIIEKVLKNQFPRRRLEHQATCITLSSATMCCDQMHRPNRSCTLSIFAPRDFVPFPVSPSERFTDRLC